MLSDDLHVCGHRFLVWGQHMLPGYRVFWDASAFPPQDDAKPHSAALQQHGFRATECRC